MQVFFPPLSCNISNTQGGVFLLPSLPDDLLKGSGIREARKQFMAAVYAAQQYGVKVILLAASMKRLFGASCQLKVDQNGQANRKGKPLGEHFPDILFTNGDNGTAYFFRKDIKRVLYKAQQNTRQISPAVIGTGLLGMAALEYLLELGYTGEQLQVVTGHPGNLQKLMGDQQVTIRAASADMDACINVVIICTHRQTQRLTVDQLQEKENGVYILDVAVPSGLSEHDYNQCIKADIPIYRQDGGNAYSDSIDFHFDPTMIGLRDKLFYGCFAEATVLAMEIMSSGTQKTLRNMNLFSVNTKSRKKVGELFQRYDFDIPPTPRCFNKVVS